MASLQLILSAVCALATVQLCRLSEGRRPMEQDLGEANIRLIHAANRGQSERKLPDVLHYEVQFNGTNNLALLRLERQWSLSDLLVHVVGENGSTSRLLVPAGSDQDVAFYHDQSTRAAVAVSFAPGSLQATPQLEGTFYHNLALYSLSHRDFGTNISKGSNRRTARGHRVSHVLVEHGESDHTEAESRSSPRSGRSADAKDNARKDILLAHLLKGHRERRQATTPTNYIVDMMYISDYYLYQRVQSWLVGTQLPSTASDAAREVAIMLATAANQVNLIYRMINQTWSIGTNLAVIYVVTTPSDSAWMDSYSSSSNSNGVLTLNVGNALSGFGTWLTSYLQANGLPRADHTALFTGYDIFTVSGTAANYAVVGYASVAAACTSSGNAIVELISPAIAGQIHAHELGHSLGANHDGIGTACNISYGWVMEPVQPFPSAPNYDQFSPCSIASMTPFISNALCLTTNMAPYDTSALGTTYTVPLGMRYTVHDQCRMTFGSKYRACGGTEYGQQVCTMLWCYDLSKTSLSCTAMARPEDGTPCGNQKWCVQGKCVSNSSAPAGSDSCPIGDIAKNQTIYSDSSVTCLTLPSYYCYTSSAYNSCCGTCDQLRNASWPSCPYGDRVSNCAGSWLYNCNTATFYNDCCKYCETNKLNIANCPYGDYYTNCATYYPSICKNSKSQCCKTCASYTGKG